MEALDSPIALSSSRSLAFWFKAFRRYDIERFELWAKDLDGQRLIASEPSEDSNADHFFVQAMLYPHRGDATTAFAVFAYARNESERPFARVFLDVESRVFSRTSIVRDFLLPAVFPRSPPLWAMLGVLAQSERVIVAGRIERLRQEWSASWSL